MKVIEKSISNIICDEDTVIALGAFDGVHRGHRELIGRTVDNAKKLGYKSSVFTFLNHPSEVLAPQKKVRLITNNKIKTEIIEELGVDYLFLVPFNSEMAIIEPEAFVSILTEKLNAKQLVCGYNFSFGYKGKGNGNTLKNLSQKYSYDVDIVDRITYKGSHVSSSVIRKLFEEGNIEKANELLGYCYYYKGEVVQGKKLARTIGMPTANVWFDENICIKNGVYITSTVIDGKEFKSVSNVGYNPTFDEKKRVLETCIFDFDENLYGRNIEIMFHKFRRGEMKFDNVEKLKATMTEDMESAKKYFDNVYNG